MNSQCISCRLYPGDRVHGRTTLSMALNSVIKLKAPSHMLISDVFDSESRVGIPESAN